MSAVLPAPVTTPSIALTIAETWSVSCMVKNTCATVTPTISATSAQSSAFRFL